MNARRTLTPQAVAALSHREAVSARSAALRQLQDRGTPKAKRSTAAAVLLALDAKLALRPPIEDRLDDAKGALYGQQSPDEVRRISDAREFLRGGGDAL